MPIVHPKKKLNAIRNTTPSKTPAMKLSFELPVPNVTVSWELEVEDKIARLMACLPQGGEQIKRELARAVPTYHPRFDNSTNPSPTVRTAD